MKDLYKNNNTNVKIKRRWMIPSQLAFEDPVVLKDARLICDIECSSLVRSCVKFLDTASAE